MLVECVHHVSFRVRDLQRSRGFYGELLGLDEIPRPDFGVPGVWYVAGGTQIHLIAAPPGDEPGGPRAAISPIANHCAFAIPDYAKTLDALRTRGVEVLETTPEQGQMWLLDPDGNVIELVVPRE